MNILITGAFGFVGTNLSKALKTSNKHHLFAIDIKEPAKHLFDEYFAWSDLVKVNWSKVDVIIHLAGKAHDTKNTTEESTYFDINVGLTKQIVDHFIQSTATKFIFFSSVKAVADRVENELTESELANPQTPYGRSKLAAEDYILGQPLPPNKKVFILRPCMIHGPGNKGNLNLLYKVVKKGIPWPLGAYANRRSMVSIDNLSFVISGLIEKEIASGIYNVGDDESLSTNELIILMAATMGKPARIWKWNKAVVQLAAKMGSVLHLPLNTERLQKLTENYVVSNAKIKEALGVDMMPVRAEDGLRKTVNSFQ